MNFTENFSYLQTWTKFQKKIYIYSKEMQGKLDPFIQSKQKTLINGVKCIKIKLIFRFDIHRIWYIIRGGAKPFFEIWPKFIFCGSWNSFLVAPRNYRNLLVVAWNEKLLSRNLIPVEFITFGFMPLRNVWIHFFFCQRHSRIKIME